jgi:hypothetical protein
MPLPALAVPIIASVAGHVAGTLVGKALGGGKGGGGSPLVMPPNPHVQTPTQYAMGQHATYVAGRGFRGR